jgi:tetratricopeptide (TPR) repeat protein
MILVVVAAAIMVLSGSLSNRSGVFSVAIDLFLQKPLTGNGLFSYGESSMPFLTTPHRMISAHAHSVLFNVMAELGLVGIVALGYSIISGVRAILANRRALPMPDRRSYDALVAVLIGLSVHQLIDMALLYLALLIFIIVTLVITPVAPQPITQPATRRGLTVALSLLFLGLLLGAMWYMPLVARYEAILTDRRQQVAYSELIQQLQSLVDLDPENRTYRLQLAVLAGEYAYQTDDAADIEAAIQYHQEALKLMPHLPVGWSNLASLYWQVGDMDAASDAAGTAVLYSDGWPLPHWQYRAYSHSQRIPWSIKPRRTTFRDSLIFVYMHDLSEPISLTQATASVTMPPDELWLALVHRLLAIEFPDEVMSN